MTSSRPPRRSTLLIIMDGMGLNPSRLDNAVALARTPNLDELYSSNPVTVLEASGAAVGLPAGQMGNSEVGHLTIGCCLLYTSPSPRDRTRSRMPSSA